MALKRQIIIIRPSDTTAYAAGDVINNDGSTEMIKINFSDNLKALLGGQLISSDPISAPTIYLQLFSESFTIAADNTPFDPTIEQLKKRVGVIKFLDEDWIPYASNKDCAGKPIAPQLIDSTVYGVLTVGTAFTPISGEVFVAQFDSV